MWQKAKNIYHLLVAVAANTLYRFPSRKLIVIGITGTDGKTTTSSLVYHILQTAGKQVSLISTISAIINGKSFDTGFHVTNPASVPLQRFIKKAQDTGKGKAPQYLVLEVTSHGIDQNRIWGIPFTIAGITNVSHEHLDYHKTYENYVKTKARLLQKAGIAVVNKDDMSYALLQNHLHGKKVITYGLKDADITTKTMPFISTLPGIYNTYNCLLASAMCLQLGISPADIKKGIATFALPKGRTEIVYKKDFTVMIDFAHTPNAFAQLLPAIKPSKGRLIHVFGSAGLRDTTKRPEMGKFALEYDDIMILTAEDPRTEKVEEINAQIKKGIEKNKSKAIVLELPNRQEAITKAISLAKKGDMVVITGKAHEQSMNYGKGEEKWDEFAAVEKALRLRSGL